MGNQNFGYKLYTGGGVTNQIPVGVANGFIGAGGFNTSSANNSSISAGIFNKNRQMADGLFREGKRRYWQRALPLLGVGQGER